jgi:hypothetical protein
VYEVIMLEKNNCFGKLSTPFGSESYTRTEDHPLLPTGQQPSKQKRNVSNKHSGTSKSTLDKSSQLIKLA